MNTLGTLLRLTTFGESHGPAMGGILDGFPAGFRLDTDRLNAYVARRRPGGSALVTARNEPDRPRLLSGISPDGLTLGTPIGFIVLNSDTRSGDYDKYADKYRPSHADFAYDAKYGLRDWRGGGRSSARETVNWVVGGAMAAQWLESHGVTIEARLIRAGGVGINPAEAVTDKNGDARIALTKADEEAIHEKIAATKADGDSIGGVVTCLVKNLPTGLGEPVFDKLHSRLGQSMLSLNAVKAFEYGDGTALSDSYGSEANDTIIGLDDGQIKLASNHSGGIQGGISIGAPVFFNVYFKPTPTIMKEISTVGADGRHCVIPPKGRHDPCVALRGAVVVEALAALTLMDMWLLKNAHA